jgi:hypothetical protein
MKPYNSAAKKFDNAYDAGYDAGKNGADNINSHYRFFASKESMQEWERGKRNAEAKEKLTKKKKSE